MPATHTNLQGLDRLILKIILDSPGGVTPAYITQLLSKSNNPEFSGLSKDAIKMRVHRAIKRLSREGKLKKKQINSRLIFYDLACPEDIISLLQAKPVSKIQTGVTTPRDGPKGLEKSKAKLLKLVRVIPYQEKTEKQRAHVQLSKSSMLSKEQKEDIINHFKNYVFNTNCKKLLFVKKSEYKEDNVLFNYMILQYFHRFNHPQYWQIFNDHTRRAFKKAAKKYRWGVHLTLTLDPKKFKNNIIATFEARKQINSLLTNLRQKHNRKTGKKLSYIKFCEFQENGMIHFHVIIFGRRWIGKVKSIALSMWKLGYVHAYQIVNRKGEWVYPRKKPKDYNTKFRKLKEAIEGIAFDGGQPTTRSAQAYFYFTFPAIGEEGKITESDYDSLDEYYKINFALLWAYNLRAKTNSRDFDNLSKSEELDIWSFLGGFFTWQLRDIIYRISPELAALYARGGETEYRPPEPEPPPVLQTVERLI